jgi:Ca2+-binding EF-hand superfamily protein
VKRRFQRLDADRDGRISRDEAGRRPWFDRADADDDGFVTPEEARNLRRGR